MCEKTTEKPQNQCLLVILTSLHKQLLYYHWEKQNIKYIIEYLGCREKFMEETWWYMYFNEKQLLKSGAEFKIFKMNFSRLM